MIGRAEAFRHAVRISKQLMPRRQRRARLPRKQHPDAIARDYFARLRPILEAARRRVLAEVGPLLDHLAAEGRAARTDAQRADASSFNDAMDRVSRAFFDGLNVAQIEALAREYADKTTAFEKEQAQRLNRAAFGVDVIGNDPNLSGRVGNFIAENVALIKSIPSQFFDDVEKQIMRAVSNGASAEQLAAVLKDRFGVAEDRARFIARDQVGKFFGQVTEARQRSMGVTKYVWRTSNDERVRPEHAAREGEVFEWSSPPEGGHPGEDFQCFPGETVLTPSSGVQKLYRRRITDNLTTLVAANGVALCATGNHPILTASGWKAAKDIDVGEYLVEIPDKVREVLGVDREGAETSFIEAFRAADLIWPVREAHVLRGGFHGDAVLDQDVDVVDVDWGLSVELDPALDERVCYDVLSRADEPATSLGAFAQLFDARLLSSHRGVRGFCKLASLLLVEEGVPGEHAFRAIAWRDAAADKLRADGCARSAEALRKLFDAVPFGVEGDRLIARELARVVGRTMMQSAGLLTACSKQDTQAVPIDEQTRGSLGDRVPSSQKLLRVVEKRIGETAWSGHVYNLQSPDSQYIAQGVVVHNCRCSAEPVLDDLLNGDEPVAQAEPEPEPPKPEPPVEVAPPPPPPPSPGPSAEEVDALRAAHARETALRLAEQELARAERARAAEERARFAAEAEQARLAQEAQHRAELEQARVAAEVQARRQAEEHERQLAIAEAARQEAERARVVSARAAQAAPPGPSRETHLSTSEGVTPAQAREREAALERNANARPDLPKLAERLARAEVGPMSEVRETLNQIVAGQGARLSTSDLGDPKFVASNTPAAFHHWDGTVEVTVESVKQAGEILGALTRGEVSPAWLAAREASFQAERARLVREETAAHAAARRAPKAKREALKAEANAATARLLAHERTSPQSQADALSVLVHETMHGHSPLAGPGAYRGTGAVVEEITTEAAARLTAERAFPGFAETFTKNVGEGSYKQYIEPVARAQANAVGISVERSYDLLKEASLDVKRDHRRLARTPDELVDIFVGKMADRLFLSGEARLEFTHRMRGEIAKLAPAE